MAMSQLHKGRYEVLTTCCVRNIPPLSYVCDASVLKLPYISYWGQVQVFGISYRTVFNFLLFLEHE
jgi:hypothetical protein